MSNSYDIHLYCVFVGETYAELRHLVLQAREYQVKFIVFNYHGKEAVIAPLSAPKTVLDRRRKISHFQEWVARTRVH